MWTKKWFAPYSLRMAAAEKRANDIRRIRMPDEIWEAYAEVVGEIGRAQDIKDYVRWRIDNPRTPLPGRRMGPVVRHRPGKSADTE
jgi:hypothetical protein